jgi:hypothetical protein
MCLIIYVIHGYYQNMDVYHALNNVSDIYIILDILLNDPVPKYMPLLHIKDILCSSLGKIL